jgi:predicted RNA-binding Zn-ribbon protein involved in translation (DUF1610 family)
MRYEEMSADEKLKYVASLLRGDAQPCPDCGESQLVPLHPRRKSKHGDINWKCPACGKIVRTAEYIPIK